MKTFWKDWKVLTKHGITMMCLCTMITGYLFAPSELWSMTSFVACLFGTYFLVAGSCILNMYIERENDASMKRTANRPIPAGRVKANHALFVGIIFSVGGTLCLFFGTSPITTFLGFLAWFLYLFVYTPLKKKTSFFLLIGTIPGAIPPLLGWTSVIGEIDFIAWVLFFILVFWQMPHFLALSLMCKEDYKDGGIVLLSEETSELFTRLQAVLYCFLLLFSSLLLAGFQATGVIYIIFALIAGLLMLFFSFQMIFGKQYEIATRRLFFSSLVYLPLWACGLVIDKIF